MRTVMAVVLAATSLATSLAATSPAFAQDGSVVVMRRALDPKTRAYAWVPSEWSQCSNSCGAGQQTRAVQCTMNGKLGAPEVNCTSQRPKDVQACYDVQACSYSWSPGDWSDVAGCGDVTQTRSLSCLRSDGRQVSDDSCPRPVPDTARTARDLRTCSYAWKSGQWGSWSSECQTAATRTRDAWCERSNGERVDDASCAASGTKPETRDVADRYGRCGYSWKAKDWGAWSSSCQTGATRSRAVVCLRSNGDEVSDAFCASAGERPAAAETGDQYGACSYSWKSGDWGQVAPACGSSARVRTVQCVRSNGDVVADGSCDVATRPASTEASADYSTCTYSWNPGAWSAPSSSCGFASETRSVACLSSDGRTMSDSYCSGPRPDASKTSYETSGCGYSWKADAQFGASVPACGATVQNRSVVCLRSDGQTVADSSCDSASRPASQQAATDYSTCTYGWTAGSYGAWSTTCGAATQTRDVTCQSSDGRTVADAYCAGTRPDATQNAYQTSGCGYSWQTGSYGAPASACGATVQTRAVTCRRSDGTTVADASCDASTRPSTTQPATDYSTCTYDWSAGAYGAWSTTCGSASQSRTVACVSSDGRTVADGYCGAATRPASSQSAYQTAGCGYSWQTGSYGTPASACGATVQTRAVTCQRSDGTTVADASCDASTRPSTTQAATDYSACGYSWNAGGWGAWSTTCGQASQSRTVTCRRSDGATVADASCAGAGTKPDSSQSAYQVSGCGYSWQTGSYGAAAAACGSSSQSRSVWCQRSDGTTVSDSYCGSGKPATSQSTTDYSACGYGWTYGGWSTTSQSCGAINQSRSVWCRRSDGVTVADGYCGSGKPSTSQSYADYSSCTYSVSGWSGYSYASSCSTSTTATQTATGCRRSDGTAVDVSVCASNGVATTQTTQTSNLSSCSYSWQTGGWSAQQNVCTTGTQTRDVWCQRADGTRVDGSLCGGGQPSGSQNYSNTNGCSWSYQILSDWSPAQGCGTYTQNRSVVCMRSDGAWDDNSLCPGGASARPADNQQTTNYKTCSYWVDSYGDWSTCSGGQQTRTGRCWRAANGSNQIVDDSACTSRGMSMTQTQSCQSQTACQAGQANGTWVDTGQWGGADGSSWMGCGYFGNVNLPAAVLRSSNAVILANSCPGGGPPFPTGALNSRTPGVYGYVCNAANANTDAYVGYTTSNSTANLHHFHCSC
jgi:hypothetical protein